MAENGILAREWEDKALIALRLARAWATAERFLDGGPMTRWESAFVTCSFFLYSASTILESYSFSLVLPHRWWCRAFMASGWLSLSVATNYALGYLDEEVASFVLNVNFWVASIAAGLCILGMYHATT